MALRVHTDNHQILTFYFILKLVETAQDRQSMIDVFRYERSIKFPRNKRVGYNCTKVMDILTYVQVYVINTQATCL